MAILNEFNQKKYMAFKAVLLTAIFAFSIFIWMSERPGFCSRYVESESDLKVAFLFHFTKFVTWPENSNKKNNDVKGKTETKEKDLLTIGVLAKGPLLEALKALDGKKTQKKVIKIIPLEDVPEDLKVNVLFIQKGFEVDLKKLVKFAIKNHVLTVSDGQDAGVTGIIISMYKMDAKIRFDINLQIAERSKLLLSSKLLRLARRVIR